MAETKTYPSFICTNGRYARGADYWLPEITGDWRTDNDRGKRYADEMVSCISMHQNPTSLGHMVKAMIGKGSWSGVEVGFFHRISEYIISANIEVECCSDASTPSTMAKGDAHPPGSASADTSERSSKQPVGTVRKPS